MSELADDEPEAFTVTDFVFDRNKTKKKSWKFCIDATAPRSEIVFMSQKIIILTLLIFCIYKLSFTQLSCEETSVWFFILPGLVGYMLPNPRI